MAIDEADQSDAGDFSEEEASDPESEDNRPHGSDADSNSSPGARVGEYTWETFMGEYGYGDEISTLYPEEPTGDDQLGLDTDESARQTVPSGDDWNQVEFDPAAYLGYRPDDVRSELMAVAGDNADALQEIFLDYVDPETTPVTKDVWTWEHYKWEYYYEDDGSRPRDGNDEIVRHDEEEALGFDPDTLEQRLFAGDEAAMELDELVEERTVNIQEDIEEDEFFSTDDGNTTVSNRYDLEKAVPMDKKTHFREVERYWVNKPYAYVIIFHSEKENEKKYYMIEPYLNEIEIELQEFLSGKLRTAIKYSDDGVKKKATEDGRRVVIEDETRRLLKRYDLFEKASGSTQASILETVQNLLDNGEEEADEAESGPVQLEGIEVRPEPAILADDPDTLNEYQVEKLLYQLKRNFIGYERIDGIKHDINVEDISVDGYNSPVFVYHSEYEQIISNIYHGEDELDDFVVKLAQRSGKGISKRLPQVDATLPDGSRAQLTLGQEVSDHGTNYTIRQFKDVPFTPIDLINWNTFSLDEMAFLWLCIENHKSLIFAGGTASGKTTSLNAVSLFIPSSAKIVSIEDTREVELPQRNWIASVTRPSFSDDEQGDVDEFDLLEAALRQRPDYIVMGEIRGEEGRTLFQVMSTGHTTYTTFHADSVDEVLKRFTTDPINVSKTMFTALDLVSIQTQTRVQGRKVRRNKSLTEINHYEAEHDEINVQDVYQWQAETDEYLKMGDSNTLDEIQFDRGWSNEKLEEELFKREVILAYLIKNGLNTYAEVAATAQAFINDPDTILTLIANGQLEDSLEDLREMESVLIDVDPEKEELVPRPDASDETYNLSMDLLERAEESLFEEYRGKVPSGLASSLGDVEEAEPIAVDRADTDEFEFAGEVDDTVEAGEWELGDGSTGIGADSEGESEPAWLSDDTGFDIGSGDGGAEETTAEATAADSATGSPSSVGDSNAGVDGGDVVGQETAETGASPPATTNAGTEPAPPTSNSSGGTTVLPSDDPEDGDLGGLFDDMDETIDRLDAGETAPTASDPVSETTPDTSDFDSMFPGGDLESIFDPDAGDETAGDFSEQIETADGSDRPATSADEAGAVDTATETGENPKSETTETKDTEAPTIELDLPSTDEPSETADEPADSADALEESDEPDTLRTDEGSNSDESTADERGAAADGTSRKGAEERDPSSIVADDDTGADTDTVDGPESIVDSEKDVASSTDDGRSAGPTDDSPADATDEPETPPSGSPHGENAGQSESIFGNDDDPIFAADEDDVADDDGSLFGDDEQTETDDSIFKRSEDTERDEGDGDDGSLFDDSEETDS